MQGYKSYFSFGYDRILTKQDDGTDSSHALKPETSAVSLRCYLSLGFTDVSTLLTLFSLPGTYTLERPESMIANGLRALGVDVPTHGGVKISRDGSEGR